MLKKDKIGPGSIREVESVEVPKKIPGTMCDGQYILKTPLELADKKITEVEIHPLKGKDMIAAERELMTLSKRDFSEAGSYERQVSLVARLIRFPLADAVELSLADITELQGFLS